MNNVLYSFVSHVDGKNAQVRIFSDRVEWEKPRGVSGYSRDELKHEPCCAKCRRGMPSYGVLPCGFDGLCTCHSKVAEMKEEVK